MNNKNKIYLIGGGVGLIVIAILVGLYLKTSRTKDAVQTVAEQEVSTDDPVDIVLDFYTPWLDAVKSSSTVTSAPELLANRLLSTQLRTRLTNAVGHAVTEIDSILCQTTVPEGVTGRIVVEREDEARVLVIAKDKTLTAQSVFTLKRFKGGWFIDDIACSPGEFDLPREFTFDREGYLLKNVPPPLTQNSWHIVFEENGELGHAVPLFFVATSTCVSANKSESVCNPDQFVEAVKIHAYGQMTERGAEVARLEFIEE